MDLDFFFLQDPKSDPLGTAAAARPYVSGPSITDVSDMVDRVVRECTLTKGTIRSLTIMGHGLDDPSGLNDPAMNIQIGKDSITLETLPKFPKLGMLTKLFQSGAIVYLSGCKVGTSPKLLQAFSLLWGGVKVIGWTGGIAVCDSWICYITPQVAFRTGITYQGSKVICVGNSCKSVPEGAFGGYGTDPFPWFDRTINPSRFSGRLRR